MWFYLAYPDGDKSALLPITVSADIKLINNDYQNIMESNPIAYDLPTFIMLNLQDIMMLADRQSPPEYFLWNMLKVDTITKLMNEGYDRMAL